MNPFLDNKTLNYEVFSTFDNYPKCSVVQELPYSERCTYVKNTKECIDKKYYVNYIYLLYCGIDPQDSVQQTFGSMAMVLLILIMFIVLTITTEKLFCPSLKVMSKLLGLSEHLAGITLVAFGNGSPDLFTSLAALNSPQPLVFSQLFGAGIFVSSVVGGTICIFCPFKMLPNSIMRDGCFYILSAVYIEFIVTTGHAVTVLESVGVLSIYFFYMFTNFTDQFLLTRHVKKMEALIANDRSYATEDNIIELAELKEEIGNDNPEANVVPTQEPLDDSKPANADLFKQFLWAMNPWEHNEWVENKGNYILRAYTIFKVPVNFLLQIWIPITDFELENFGWSKLMNMFHLIVMPPGMAYLFLYPQKLFHLHYFCWAFILFAPLSIVVFFTSRTDRPPRYHKLFAILSVSGSIAIIYITAAEAVEMLYVLGIIMHCSVAFLGATLVAWGNSIGDMVADVTLSRAGYQKMGFAACYGGPLFNTLLGFGIQTMYHTLNGSTGSVQLKEGHLGEDCYVFLCVILFSTLIWATSTNFYARRSVGFFSITIYFIYITFICLGETSVIQTYAPNVPDGLP